MATNLKFFSTNSQSQPLPPQLLEKSESIIEECKRKLLLVTDLDVRNKLNAVIDSTCEVVLALHNMEDPASIYEKLAQLQMDSAKLPIKLEQQSNLLSSVSNTIATACLFILASSFALSLGFAFYALCYLSFDVSLITQYLVSSLSAIGIPGAVLGTFSYFLGQEQTPVGSNEVLQLQQNIDEVCQITQASLSI